MKSIMLIVFLLFFVGSGHAKQCASLDAQTLRTLSHDQSLVDPCELNKVELRADKPVVLFIAAHPDDETIGMSGFMTALVRDGYQVVVEMMTDGQGSSAIHKITSRGININGEEFGEARFRELIDSMRRIGVAGVVLNPFQSMKLTKDQVSSRINYWLEKPLDIVRVVGTAGFDHDYAKHPDHEQIYQAIKENTFLPGYKKQWALIYGFRLNDLEYRWGGVKFYMKKWLCDMKRNALNAYKVWNPDMQRYSIGWTLSTPDLFEGAYRDCNEYYVLDDTPPSDWGPK